MAFDYYQQTGLVIRPDGTFHADILYDYLKTTTYKWKCNAMRTVFLIEDFEYSIQELSDRLNVELDKHCISAEFHFNEE